MLNSRMYNIDVLKAEDDRNWEYFVQRNGYSPSEYMNSDTYRSVVGGMGLNFSFLGHFFYR